MPVQAIIETLTELVDIHDKLIELSKEKTEIIKEGSVEKLQQILSSERKSVQALEKVEKNRQKQVEIWCSEQKLPKNDMTITKMLELISEQVDAKRLEEKTIKLTQTITKLKQQEQLNKELIHQSMQFVQLSMDMISPTINNLNYGKNKESTSIKRSMFDSKA